MSSRIMGEKLPRKTHLGPGRKKWLHRFSILPPESYPLELYLFDFIGEISFEKFTGLLGRKKHRRASYGGGAGGDFAGEYLREVGLIEVQLSSECGLGKAGIFGAAFLNQRSEESGNTSRHWNLGGIL